MKRHLVVHLLHPRLHFMVVFRREDNTDKLIFIRIIAFAFMLLFVLLAIDNLKVVKYRAVHGVRQIETEIVNVQSGRKKGKRTNIDESYEC